jgi:hypothetical protein
MASMRTANGARSLADRAEQRADQIARRIVDQLVESIPAYGKLPEEQLGGEILAIARHNVELFVAYLRTGEPPDLEAIRASAIRRAEERVPLDALLEAYHLGASLLWETIRAEARPEEVDEVLAAAAVVFSYLRQISMTVADAYLEEREALSVEERDARRSLLEAVLEGRSTEDAATRSGIQLAPRLVVLAVALGASPDEERPGVNRAVAARRKQRRIEERLLADLSAPGGDGVQTLLGPGGGTILVPTDEPGTIDLDQLVGSLAAAGPCEVWAAAAWAPSHAAVPGALAEARQVLRLAREGGRPPGGYRLADVLLDHLVSQPEAAGPLRGLLQPLEEGSELLATLEAWFAVDFDRRATAAALVIHPNTLDYRLRRISELTGLDLRTAEAIQLLGAALLARRQAAASDRADM